ARAPAPVPAEESARPAAEVADARAFEPAQVATMLETAQLDDAMIEIELTNLGYGYDPFDDSPPVIASDEVGVDFQHLGPAAAAERAKRVRRVSVKEARRLLTRDEANKLVDFEEIGEQAIQRRSE